MAALPTTGISVMMVRNAIGYPSTDVGTLCGGTAASAARINKWSKHKPVHFPHDSTDAYPDWWKAQNKQCGLVVPSAVGVDKLIALARGGGELWAYDPPTGGASSPYRLGDFRGYNHDAINPVRVSVFPSVAYKDTSPNLSGAIDTFAVGESNLSLADISGAFALSGTYPGIIVARVGQTTGQLVTGSVAYPDPDSGGVTVPISSLLTDVEYDFIYVFSERRQTTFGPVTDGSSYFVVAPSDNAVQRVRIQSGGIYCDPRASKDGVVVSWSLRFVNNSASTTVTVTKITVTLAYADFTEGSALESGETTLQVSDQTVTKGKDTVVSGTAKGILPDFDTRGAKIIAAYTYAGIRHTYEGPFDNAT